MNATGYRIRQLSDLPLYRVEEYREPRWWRAGGWRAVRLYSGVGEWNVAEFNARFKAEAFIELRVAADEESTARKAGDWRRIT